MNVDPLLQYQEQTHLAGLIDQRFDFGPDMPFEAKALARLPLLQLRRVLPENPHRFWLNIIDEQVLIFAPGVLTFESGDFKFVRYNGSGDLVFTIWSGGADAYECSACDGDGYFDHGSHEYECRDCDGTGKVEPNTSDALARVVISQDGTIKWEECNNVTRKLAI